MSDFARAQYLARRLESYCPHGAYAVHDEEAVVFGCLGLIDDGWTDLEIVRKLRWLEHVDPTVEEDRAIRNMALIDLEVKTRKEAK